MNFDTVFKFLQITRLWITLAPAVAAIAFLRGPLLGAGRQAVGR